MKKLGMIGGTGPESTISYYRAITSGVCRTVGDNTLPPLTIESLSAFEVMGMADRDDREQLTAYLLRGVENLARAGAQIGTLTGLTPHLVFGELQAASPIPLISAVEATLDAVRRQGLSRLILLGTEFTMTRDFFTGPFRDAGIDLILPDASEVGYIQTKIFDELEHGVVTDDTRNGFVDIISRLRDDEGAEQVILGCTELPLLLDDRTSPLPCLDVVQIHTETLIGAVVDAA